MLFLTQISWSDTKQSAPYITGFSEYATIYKSNEHEAMNTLIHKNPENFGVKINEVRSSRRAHKTEASNYCSYPVIKNNNLLNSNLAGPVITASTVIVCDGATTVDIPIKVSNLNNAGSFSLSFGFSPSELSLLTIVSRNSVFDIPGHEWDAFEYTTNSDTLAAGIFKVTGIGIYPDDGITLDSNAVLFTLRFNVGIVTTSAVLSFIEDLQGTSCEFTGVSPSYIPFTDFPSSNSYIPGGVVVVNDPSITISSDFTAICEGGMATLSAEVLGGTGNCSVQWQYNNGGIWTNIFGANGSAYIASPTSSTEYLASYSCTGNGCNPAVSDTRTVNVDPASVGGIISGTSEIIYGASTGIMTLSGYTGSIQYWEKRLYSGSWIIISNQDNSYTETPLSAGIWQYRAVIKSGVCSETFSSGFSVTVLPKSLIIKADDKSKMYDGLVIGMFTVTYNGLAAGETAAVLGGLLSFSGNAVTAVNTGYYSIIPGGLTSDNYTISFQNGTLDIYRASSTYVINNLNSTSGSLRDVIANTADNGVIHFSSDIDGQTIFLISGSLIIDRNIIIDNSNHIQGITIGSINNIFTIQPGKTLNLASGSKITVLGSIINNGGKGNAGLVLASGSSFIHNTLNLSATVQRYLNNSWHLFGSPFVKNKGAALSNIIPVNGNVQMKTYTNGINWGANVTSPLYQFLPFIGYAVKPSVSFTASLTGNLYYSPFIYDYTSLLVYNGTAATQSWNLVANPYTSYIDWNLLGKTNISSTLYLWDNSMYPLYTPVTNTAYFRTYNSCNNIGVPAGTNPFIAPLQGFFVKAVYSNPKISFPPSARTHNNSSYYKDGFNSEILVRLKTETELGTDELVICKNPDAKLDFEQFDSEKLFNDMPVEIYSLSSASEKLIINSINTTNTIIPIGIKGNAGAKAKITAFALESSEQVFLEDRFKGKLMRLSENSVYNFEFQTDEVTDRFFIHFSDLDKILTNSDIKVFENENVLKVIAQTGEEIQNIEIFALTGACVYTSKLSCNNIIALKLMLDKGVYLVRVKTSVTTQNIKINWK